MRFLIAIPVLALSGCWGGYAEVSLFADDKRPVVAPSDAKTKVQCVPSEDIVLPSSEFFK